MLNESELLLHYSCFPLTEVHAAAVQGRDRKPNGLWVSVGDSWHEWCTGEGFHLEALAVVTEVVLADDADILRLSTAEELDLFTAEYGEDDKVFSSSYIAYDAIDWREIAKQYQGIIIAPYIWARRLELMWYYSWDCASGCIWDPAAVAELRQAVAK